MIKTTSLLTVLFLSLLLLPPMAAAQTATITIIPPVINAAGKDAAGIKAMMDKDLGQKAAAADIILIDTAETEDLFPGIGNGKEPTLAQLKKTLSARTEIIVLGSITYLGGRLSLDATAFDLRKDGGRSHFFEEGESPADLPDLLAAMISKVKNFRDRDKRVAEVVVRGNRKIDSGAILSKVETAAGSKPEPKILSNDIKKIFAMGYFNDVAVSVTDGEEGQDVTFTVKEKPVIRKVEIKGRDKVKESDLKEVIKLRPAMIMSDTAISETRAAILKLYGEKGYHDCRLEITSKKAPRGRVDVIIKITEGKRLFVRKIFISGNESFSDRKIRKAMLTKKKGWFSWLTDSGLLKEGMLEHDGARIAAFYHNEGFLDVRVTGPELKKDKKGFNLYINIVEGIRYRPGNITVSGDIIETRKKILERVKVGEEKYFSRRTMREDVMRVSDFYSEHGFAFAEVEPILSRDRDKKTVDLTFEINKGNMVRVNRILIKGNTRTRDKVIRREIKLTEGGIFNSAKIRKSRENLLRLDFFDKVNITPRPTDTDDLLDIEVDVKDKPTGTFSIGAGYSSVDRLSFMGEIKEANFLGRGQQLAAQVDISSISNRYNLSFTEPHIFDSKLMFGINLYNWSREYDDYTKDSTGGAIRFGYPVYKKWRFIWSYGYDDTSLSDVNLATATSSILESMQYHITSAVKIGLSRETRNRRYAATKGSHQSFTVKYAGGPLGGDNGFTKVEASAGKILPVSKNTHFYARAAMGYVQENGGGHLPVYEKFYLGGMNTIRGFNAGEISPTETVTLTDPLTGLTYQQKDRIGGTKMWYGNFEYIFPLLNDSGLNGVIFYDLGNVYDRYESWRFRDVKNSAGFGFRWLSPVGPLRLEWGRNLNPKEGEDTSNWDFSIGGAF